MMNKECQNCKSTFIIEDEDLQFYKKIDVPAPTHCPDCRVQRRYAWRNDRNLYRRDCDLCGKSTVSMYSADKQFKVYCPNCWWGDGWDSLEFGQDYDSKRSFFDQLKDLQKETPRISLLGKNSVNSEYTNHSSDNKNCFLCSSAVYCEDTLYSDFVMHTKDCVDVTTVRTKAERCYECVDVDECYQCQFCVYMRSCSSCYYCYDCRGCSDCFLSTGLRNKKYCFLNQEYSRDEYRKKVEEFNLGSYADRKKLLKQFQKILGKDAIHRYAIVEQSVNVTGDYITNSKNLRVCFDVDSCEDSKYLANIIDAKDSMDSYRNAYDMELIYECQALVRDYNTMFTNLSYDDNNIQYCDHCFNSQNLFGCIAVKKGEYMILNKKYSKEEYESLKKKIISDMRARGEYGEFFPISLSPFSYNESHNYLYGEKLSKEEVLAKGWAWEDNLPGTFGKETLEPKDIPDDIKDVEDSITKEVLKCESCSRNYNVVPAELQFYKKEDIPIPRLCFPCRDARRLQMLNPRKLWHRQCMCLSSEALAKGDEHKNTSMHFHSDEPCPSEFETSYAPDRPEIVYCEACYLAEIV